MSWRKVSDDLHSHPKWGALSLAARGLWVTCLSWTGQHVTDGKVPEFVVKQHAGASAKKLTAELTAAGLWEVCDEGGWQFHNYHDYQPTSYEERQNKADKSSARSEAGKKGMAKRWGNDNKPDNKPDNKTITPDPTPSPFPVSNETDRQTGGRPVGGGVFDPSGGRSTREPAAVLIRRLTATHPEFITEAERITAERGDAIDNPTSYKASILRAMEAGTYDWPAPPKPKHRRIIKLIPMLDEQGRDAPDFPVYEGQNIEETKAWLVETRGAHCLREIREAAA